MLEKTFGLLFYLKPARNQKGTVRYVYLRITVDGKVAELSTKKLWNTERWNSSVGRPAGNKEDAKTLNAYLDMLTAKVYQAKKILTEDDKEISAEGLKNIPLGKSNETRTILEVFERHNEQMEALVGQEFAPLTLKRYKTAKEHTASFIKWKYKKDDMEIKDLNFEFITEFNFWLRSARGCNHNSAIKYMSNLKKVVLICVNNKWLKRDPFQGFKLTKKEVVKNPLSRDELKRLTEKVFEVERISQVRDIFLFCCYTGLAYVDVKQLKPTDIVVGMDGEPWIDTTRQKTDAPTRIPLLDTALEIIEKYKDHPQCCAAGVVLPVLSNQKMNAYLKEIASLCGISKTLTFHIARHTFATTVTLSNKVPIETVSKMLGHRSLKQTMIYAKVRLLNNRRLLRTRSGLPLQSRSRFVKEFLMFESVDRIVMKEKKSTRTRLVGIRLTPDEYAKLEGKCARTTCRKLSEFLRQLIFGRPVTVIERNGSQDQMISELSELREELNRLGNNFNQATKRLNAVNQISEFRNWVASYEAEKTFLFSVLDKIKSQTDKLADRWLQ